MAYNRYNANTGSYRRVPEPPMLVSPLSETSGTGSSRSGGNHSAPSPDGEHHERQTAAAPHQRNSRVPANNESSGQHLLHGLESILPAGLDAGDLALTALLFLLYVESGDEDFLIMLIVTGFSIFKDPG